MSDQSRTTGASEAPVTYAAEQEPSPTGLAPRPVERPGPDDVPDEWLPL